MLKKISDKSKKIIYVISFSLLVLLFLSLMIITRDSNKIVEIKEFIKTDTKLLYITDDPNLNYPIEILDKYSINYLTIDSNELTIFESKKIENIINSKYLNNILVIYTNGKIKDALIEYDDDASVDKFLQKNNIIPENIVDNVEQIMEESEKLLDSEYSMVYIPYEAHREVEKQDEILKSIAEKYSINYNKIEAYLLSKTQQEKINGLLGLSEVENQILILIKNKKMIANIRGMHGKNSYIENLYELGFIDELENQVNKIDYDEFKSELQNDEKSIILIGIDDSKDCDNILKLLNGMTYNYEIEVDYINLDSIDSELYKKVNEKLLELGYSEGFSLPLVIIVESNQILDYIIGNSDEAYFLDVFIENGVIKGDVIDE